MRVGLTLTNDGDESAIVLQLDISHSVLGVFTDKANVEIDVSKFCIYLVQYHREREGEKAWKQG